MSGPNLARARLQLVLVARQEVGEAPQGGVGCLRGVPSGGAPPLPPRVLGVRRRVWLWLRRGLQQPPNVLQSMPSCGPDGRLKVWLMATDWQLVTDDQLVLIIPGCGRAAKTVACMPVLLPCLSLVIFQTPCSSCRQVQWI